MANHHHSIVIYMLYKNIPDTQLEYYNTYILCITDRACISRLGRLPLGVLQNKNKTNLGKFPNMGCWKNKNFIFELACKLPPFSWLSHFRKHKAHLWDSLGSAATGCHFFFQNLQRKIWKIQRKNPETGLFILLVLKTIL